MSDNAPTRYESLLQQVRKCLASLTEKELEHASKELERASDFLDEAARLLPAGGDDTEVQSLRERLTQEKERLDARREYERVKEACQRLWNQEQELVKAGTSPDTILQNIYAEAKKIAEDAYNKRPASFLLGGLKNDANIRYEQARQRYAIRTTAAQTRNYREQIEKLEAEDNKEREVPWYDARGQFIGSRRIDEALRELIIDAQNYAHDKASEYLRAAQAYLDRSQPRLAHDVLEKRTDLYLLPEEDEVRLAEFDRSRVQPLLERLSRAEDLARQAAATQDLSKGWEILDQAIATFPNAPFIEEVRKDLLRRTLGEIESRLQQARSKYETFCRGSSPNQQDLRESEQALQYAQALYRQAESAQRVLEAYLEKVREGIQTLSQERDTLSVRDQNDPLISLFDSRIKEQEKERDELVADVQRNKERLHRLQEEYNHLVQQVQAALSYQRDIEQHFARLVETFEKQPEKARDALSTFLEMYDSLAQRDRYGELSRRLPRLGILDRQIQAFEDFAGALRSLEDAFLSSIPERIEQAIREAEALREKQTDSKRRQQMDEMLRRLRGRLDFLHGRKAWQEGDFARAEELLLSVNTIPEHPDRAEAGEILIGIKKQREQEKEIQNRLNEAQALLDQRPAQAYERLVDLSNLPSSFRSQISTLRERARQRWEDDLLNRLDIAMRSSPPLAEELRTIADELLNLPEPRAPRTNQKARQAKAKAFAMDARMHEEAGRLRRALEAWDDARLLDPGCQEYVEHWRRVRFDMARRTLESGIGENETLGILRDLQNDLGDDPRVSALVVEQYYRLSRLETLDAQRRLEYLEQAVQAVKQARLRSELSASDRGRLQDLQQNIEREHTILSRQADLEQKLKEHRSCSELKLALDSLYTLREEASDGTVRRRFDDWWKRLRIEMIRRLEQTDESLGEAGNEEQRFDIRSRIALLDPEHRLARAVGLEIVRRVESLLRDIEGALNDYRGIQIEIPDAERARLAPHELVDRQHSQLETLSCQANEWYGVLERFDAQIGADVQRLKADLRKKREALSAWQDKFAEFFGNIRVLMHELNWVKQHNDWGRFDDLLNNINREGFGEHRATRQILKERDAIQLQRRRLEQLCQEVRDALRSPRGDRLFDAQKAIERLHAEDPEDAFGLQESLRIEIPFGRTLVLQGLSDIEVWLKQSIEQVRIFGNWLYRSGAPHLWPKELADAVEEVPKECVNWEGMRQKVQELQQAGQYKMVYYLLDSVISERPSESPPQHTGEVVRRLTETNRDRLPIETVLESLSRLPLEEEALLPFLKDLLVDLDNFRRKLQKWLEEAKELRRQTKQREEDWHRAYAELEQTLEELRNIEGSRLRFLNPIRHRDELDRAKQRYREALLQCKEIAPYHPALHDLLKSLE